VDPVDELLAAWRAELPEVLGPESELVKRVLLLGAAFGEATAAELPALGLTAAEFDVLATLRRAGPPYARQSGALTRALLLSTGGTSNVVHRLASRGLVERQPEPDDRRAVRVVLTGDGVQLAEKAVRANTAAHARVLATVPPEALQHAADALRAVTAAEPWRRTHAARRPRPPGSA